MPEAGNNRKEESELQQSENYISGIFIYIANNKLYTNEIPGAYHYFYRKLITYTNKVQSILTTSTR